MTSPEKISIEKSAQDLQDEVVALHERKNWPDPRDNWLVNDEKGPICIATVATTGMDANGQRHELAGGMSKLYGQPYDTWTTSVLGSVGIGELNLQAKELDRLKKSDSHADNEKYSDIMDARARGADLQLTRTFESLGGPDFAKDVIIMKPQADYHTDRQKNAFVVCADDIVRTDSYIEDTRPAFMMYSNDPNRIIGIRPADCPVIVFSGIDGKGNPIHGVIHSGWNDEDKGVVKQGLDFLMRVKGTDMKNLNFYIAPGGVEFGYSRPANPLETDDPKFTDKLGWKNRLYDMKQTEKGVRFTIDMIGFAVDSIKNAGASDEQIVIDSTDTVDPQTGHSSNKLASRGDREPTRDLVLGISPDRQIN